MLAEAIENQVKCHHCGEMCEDEILQYQSQTFCCYGCQAVYQLISEHNLDAYYENTELKAPKVADETVLQRKFAFLDLPEVEKELLRFQDEVRSMVRFYLGGIHCSSCIYLLEHLPKLNPHILKAEVNFIRKEITITFDHRDLTLKQLAIVLAKIGYEPTINLNQVDKTANKVRKSNIGLKIAVAGFCFGNSMLISLPEYLDVGYQLDDQFKSLFGWINLCMALPIVGFTGVDYFKSSWRSLRHLYLNIDVPIAIGILTLFLRSAYEILFEVGPGYVDSLCGLVFFLLIGKWYQDKTYRALSFDRDYTSYFPITVSRLMNDDQEEITMLKDLHVNDRIVIHNEELIPADGILEDGKANLDYSFVTGEAEPVGIERGKQVFAGGRQLGGPITIRLNKEVNNSELTQLWTTAAKDESGNFQMLVDQVARYFTVIIVLLALGTGAYWYFTDPQKVWSTVSAVLIVACPCALALAMPFAYGHAMRVLGRLGFYLKNASVIERLNQVKHLVFDKTGTLTKNKGGKVTFTGTELSATAHDLIYSACSNSAHPLSKIIAEALSDSARKLDIDDYEELTGKGILASCGGRRLRIGSAEWVGGNTNSSLKESQVHVKIDDLYIGYFSVPTAYRQGIFEELKSLKNAFTLHLLSGDHDSEKSTLEPYFHTLHFEQKPKDKLAYVGLLESEGLMIGDGLNDAGALKAAHVGFAVCEDIHQFSPASDGMIHAEKITHLSHVLSFSRKVRYVLIAALILSFLYNIIGLSFAVSGNLTPVLSAILMPVSSISVVGFITVTVNWLGTRIQ